MNDKGNDKVKNIYKESEDKVSIEKDLVPVGLENVEIQPGFWFDRIQLVRDKIIPYQWSVLNDHVARTEQSGAIRNFRIALGEETGQFYGRPFQDSDVAKWLEAVGYTLTGNPMPELEKLADQVIDLIGRVQEPDGYLDTYFTIDRRDQRWTNVRDMHELYCAGHLIEAAVAYYQATGKRKILDIVCRLADHIGSVFGPEPGKKKGYPGHEEIELALVKLYHTTGEKRYLDLGKFFIDERGKLPRFFDGEAEALGEPKPYGPTGGKYTYEYNQSHKPVREQDVAVGHAVRATYLYSAMADLARETGDMSLAETCQKLWKNVTGKQMYLTGSIGSSAFGEAFSFDYDLPNDTTYGETCAAIGLVFWAQRMQQMDLNGKYGDAMERALYNGILSGISLDGTKYFYVNPLEVWPESCEKRNDKSRVAPNRQGWFVCACCPPNIARLFASFRGYMYSRNSEGIFIHHYANSSVNFDISGQGVALHQNTNYPWDGNVEVGVSLETPVEFTLGLRIPGWCRNYELKINGSAIDIRNMIRRGYARIRRTWTPGDKITLDLAMPVERIRANPALRADAGKVAIQRGPLVYCLEEIDNGPILADISLPKDALLKARFDGDFLGGMVTITGEGSRTDESSVGPELYTTSEYVRKTRDITAVPYFAWNNRGPGEMLVWIRET